MSILNTVLAFSLPLVDLPDPAPIMPPGMEGVTTILGIAKWAGLIVCILAVIGLAAFMAVSQRRGEGGEHAQTFVRILIAIILIGGASGLVGFIAGA